MIPTNATVAKILLLSGWVDLAVGSYNTGDSPASNVGPAMFWATTSDAKTIAGPKTSILAVQTA